jgi:4-hydroxy-tetrahydrodipicolinate synthase
MTSKWHEPITQPFSGQDIPRYLHGTITPMATPCNSDHTLDEAGIRAYVDFMIDVQKTDTLFPRGGVGKMYAFDYDQAKRLNEIVIDHAADRAPVMAGTCGIYSGNPSGRPDPETYTRESIELSQHAQKKGATAIVLALPRALEVGRGRTLEDTIVEYYRTVADSVDLPVVLYQPGGTEPGYQFTPPMLERLLEIPNVAGAKISSGDMVVFGRLAVAATGTNFAFIAGDERTYIYTMMIGATGVIGRGCNTHPEILRAVYDRMMAKDYDGARQAAWDAVLALESSGGIDSAISSLEYARRKGVDVQPFTLQDARPIAHERMDQMVGLLDSLRERYVA